MIVSYPHTILQYIIVEGLRRKEATPSFNSEAENYHWTQIQVLQSVNGGEYMSDEHKPGIKHRLTVPNMPQQNVICERLNHSLFMAIVFGITKTF